MSGQRNRGALFVCVHESESRIVSSGAVFFIDSQYDGNILLIEGIKIHLAAFGRLQQLFVLVEYLQFEPEVRRDAAEAMQGDAQYGGFS